jgi:hypothetical protein
VPVVAAQAANSGPSTAAGEEEGQDECQHEILVLDDDDEEVAVCSEACSSQVCSNYAEAAAPCDAIDATVDAEDVMEDDVIEEMELEDEEDAEQDDAAEDL